MTTLIYGSTQSAPLFNSIMRTMAMIPVACLATLLLMYLMHRLIYVEYVDIEEPVEHRMPTIVMEETVIENRIDEKPEKPQPPEPQPAKPPIEPLRQVTHAKTTVDIPRFNLNAGIQIHNNSLGGGSLIRAVSVPPQYPASALTRGIEGYVDITFDVTAYGATANVQVLAAQPPGVFDKAATKAVSRWKYKPLMVDGVATASYGIRERIRFKIEN